MRKTLLLLALILMPVRAEAFKLTNFENPESIVVDPENGSYYVSNVNGDPLAKDENGYISKISANGNTVIQKFIGQKKDQMALHAPKGLLIMGKIIFTTDIDTVKGFDKKSGKPAVIVDLSGQGAQFLNDITLGRDSLIYVSDMNANKIFVIDPRRNYEAKVFKQGPELGQPNGLIMNPKSKNLMFVSWAKGQIMEIDHRSGKLMTIKKKMSGLDGIDYDQDGFLYVSNFQSGEIYRIPNLGRGTFTTLEAGLSAPADISVNRKTKEILIPCFSANMVMSDPLNKPARLKKKR